MGHKHGVRDTGAHFTIDQFTRQIKNDSGEKTTIVQYDHNSQRLTFEMPLHIDGHAMTLCDLIEIHYINISADGKSQNPGTYEVTDIKAEGEKAIFTWLISQEATQLAGSLSFFIVFKCTENGETVYRWGTEINKTLVISDAMNNGEAIITEYPDIIAQWKAQIFGASDDAVATVEAAKISALAAIDTEGEAKKQAVLDSIPDEYEALSALADQNHRNKAGAVVVEEEGESVVLNDASEYPLMGLKVFGKSTQDGTPTPDAPVDIVSVENPVVTVCGKNLLPDERIPPTSAGNGINCKYEGNGIFHIYGTHTGDSQEIQLCTTVLYLPVDVEECYTLAVKLLEGTSQSKFHFFLGLRSDSVSFRNWFSVPLEVGTATGTLLHDSRIPGESLVDTTQIARFWIYNYNPDLTAYTVDMRVQVWLERGEEPTTYEPYTGQALTITTPDNLPGIPVASGGNYTDENGQQWICDEVDLARGVYVQRVNQIWLDGSENWGLYDFQSTYSGFSLHNALDETHSRSPGMSNQFSNFKQSVDDGIWVGVGNTSLYAITKEWYGKGLEAWKAHLSVNPLHVFYPRITPIETPLSEAEINAFKALHSNKPNTTILNDAGAYMAVEYVADTKTYIDNKIKEMIEEVTG